MDDAGGPEVVPGRRQAMNRARSAALVTAAREVFAEQGISGSLEQVARKAGVGIGTLYRHFPDRRSLIEAVYVGEVEQLVATAAVPTDDPSAALTAFVRQFLEYTTTKRAVIEALNTDSPLFQACIDAIHTAGEPLLAAAQAADVVRHDVDFEIVRQLVSGIASVGYADDQRREQLLSVVLDGLGATADRRPRAQTTLSEAARSQAPGRQTGG